MSAQGLCRCVLQRDESTPVDWGAGESCVERASRAPRASLTAMHHKPLPNLMHVMQTQRRADVPESSSEGLNLRNAKEMLP